MLRPATRLQRHTLTPAFFPAGAALLPQDDPSLVEAAVADLQAVVERDPACDSHVQPLLFFKGFQALQAHRVAHWMWARGRKSLAVALQSRMSEVFGVDIHPAATLGWGIMMDHATGGTAG
jgi:serine O-acetyltransferase